MECPVYCIIPFPHPCCRLKKICLASFHETCQWFKFPLNGLRAQSRVRPVVGMLTLASGLACLGMAFPAFLVKQLYRCDSVVISSFVRTGYTTKDSSLEIDYPGKWNTTSQLAEGVMVDLWTDFWIGEKGKGQLVTQIHERCIMMMMMMNNIMDFWTPLDSLFISLH